MRRNDRCPASDFLDDLEPAFDKRFRGSFNALASVGASYYNSERLKALVGDGKPLWEFKEHDHRLYCYRKPDDRNSGVDVVLFNGWVKDKKGKNKEETHRIETAQSLLQEFLTEYPKGIIPPGGGKKP